MTRPAPLASLWTSYAAGPDGRARCLACGAPVADGRTVRVYADGLEHYECWLLAQKVPPPAPPPAPRRPGPTRFAVIGAVAALAAAFVAVADGPSWAVVWGLASSVSALILAAVAHREGL